MATYMRIVKGKIRCRVKSEKQINECMKKIRAELKQMSKGR